MAKRKVKFGEGKAEAQQAETLQAAKIGELEVQQATERCKRYQDQMRSLHRRITENEEYYRQRYENLMGKDEIKAYPKKSSGYLLNAIINKVADIMDNYPQADIMPREKSDEETATVLSKIVPVILQRNHFTKTYYNCALEKVKNGFSILGVFWNPLAEGIGEVEVSQIDAANLVWSPGIKDIQESREVFLLKDVENDTLRGMYPELEGKLGGNDEVIPRYQEDDYIDRTDMTTVYDWYYKKTVGVEVEGQVFPRTVLHYCKFCAGHVLYSSEDDPRIQGGWYDDGKYPFVFDVLYPVKNTPYGFGLIDMMREPQEYIDRLDMSIIQNALANARPRYFSKEGGGIDEDEFTDFSKMIVHYVGTAQDIMPMEVNQLPGIYATILQNKKEELKENSGNRDFSQGTTSGGVTAASAIAALQEASSKTSRTINIISYESFEELVKMMIDRMQQFYTVSRTYRITEPEGERFLSVDAETLRPESVMDESLGQAVGGRKPIYDIEVSAEKASPYSKIANNEFAKELFNMGAFNPQLADQILPTLQMMDFDRKQEVISTVTKNQQLFRQNQMMQQLLQGLAPMITELTGNDQVEQLFPPAEVPEARGGMAAGHIETNALGETRKKDETSQAAKMKERIHGSASVGGDEV